MNGWRSGGLDPQARSAALIRAGSYGKLVGLILGPDDQSRNPARSARPPGVGGDALRRAEVAKSGRNRIALASPGG